MKIISVEATNHKVSGMHPVTDKSFGGNMVFIRVETDEGITGELPCSGSYIDSEFVNRVLAPLLVGKDPLNTERLWDEMFRSLRGPRFYAKGVGIVDCALWDIKGKYLNQPVWRLIGGFRQKIPVYFTMGSGKHIADMTPEQSGDWAKSLVKDGWTGIKFGIARSTKWWKWTHDATPPKIKTVEENVAKVRAVREAVGDKVDVMVDSNTECSLIEAVRYAKLLEPFDIAFYEEPLCENDPLLLAEMKRYTSIPIAAGQYVSSKWGFRDLITIGKVDIVQPDLRYVCGFTEALKVAHLAQAFNLPFATHSGPLLNIQLTAGLSNGIGSEFHSTSWESQKLLLKDTPEPKNSWVIVPDRPGLGLTPNEEALSEFLVK